MCDPLFLTVAGIGLLSVGTCLGFVTAALFATGAEPIKFAKPQMAVFRPWASGRRLLLIVGLLLR